MGSHHSKEVQVAPTFEVRHIALVKDVSETDVIIGYALEGEPAPWCLRICKTWERLPFMGDVH